MMPQRPYYRRPKGRYSKKPRPKTRFKPVPLKPGADARLKKIFRTIGVPRQEPFRPDPFQIEALEAIQHADCLVTAPTGSGKTWIAIEAIRAQLSKGRAAWYASPLKALSNSKYIEFKDIFGTEQVGILTGDRKENTHAPIIVGTTEILRNQLYDAMYQGNDLATDLVILDEAHYLGDEDRGVVWEEVMIYLPHRIPLLMLSATIGNAPKIAAWLRSIRSRPCRVVTSSQRPVPLHPLFLHPSGTLLPLLVPGRDKHRQRLYKKVQAVINSRRANSLTRSPYRLPPFGDLLMVLGKYNLLPAIFFLKSRSDCDRALALCTGNAPPSRDQSGQRSLRLQTILDQYPHLRNHRQLEYVAQIGVGAHHGGQLPAWKLILETLMSEGLLNAIFATSTVAAGVNFPARTVVFLNSDRFNGSEFVPLNPTQFHQMTGRAGRRGMDRVGFALAIPGKFMDTRLIARLVTAAPTGVDSQIKINFAMVLNLLLAHTPDQINNLLNQSFAAFMLRKGSRQRQPHHASATPPDALWRDFQQHLKFLQATGYVSSRGRLTADGVWASRLRVDQPLLIAEGFRLGAFPDRDPALMAGIIAAFVNEHEPDEEVAKSASPQKLVKAYGDTRRKVAPLATRMIKAGFAARPLFLRPASALFAWAVGQPWERVLSIAQLAEGDLAMLILRTADNLRHVKALRQPFPAAAATAAKAIDLLLREPVIDTMG
jgi:superfamily II RNA helicase